MSFRVTASVMATVIGLVCPAAGQSSRSDAIYGPDEKSTKSEVLKLVPIGSRIAAAREAMEAKGFACSEMKQQAYVDGGVTQSPADIVYCDSGEVTVAPGITKRWQIVFVDRNSVVVSVAAGVGTTGQ